MFMDTPPKLQPISKSRPKPSEQQSVPSSSSICSNANSSNASTSSKGGIGHGGAATSHNNNPITNAANKPLNSGATSNTLHDNNAGGTSGDIRHNNNFYRKNNCSPNHFQKNFNNQRYPRDFQRNHNFYNNHNQNGGGGGSPYNRSNWDDPTNTSVIRWKPNFNFNNNNVNNRYRKNNYINRLRENNIQFEYTPYNEDVIVNNFDTGQQGNFDDNVSRSVTPVPNNNRGTKNQNKKPPVIVPKTPKKKARVSPKAKVRRNKGSPEEKVINNNNNSTDIASISCESTALEKQLNVNEKIIINKTSGEEKKLIEKKPENGREAETEIETATLTSTSTTTAKLTATAKPKARATPISKAAATATSTATSIATLTSTSTATSTSTGTSTATSTSALTAPSTATSKALLTETLTATTTALLTATSTAKSTATSTATSTAKSTATSTATQTVKKIKNPKLNTLTKASPKAISKATPKAGSKPKYIPKLTTKPTIKTYANRKPTPKSSPKTKQQQLKVPVRQEKTTPVASSCSTSITPPSINYNDSEDQNCAITDFLPSIYIVNKTTQACKKPRAKSNSTKALDKSKPKILCKESSNQQTTPIQVRDIEAVKPHETPVYVTDIIEAKTSSVSCSLKDNSSSTVSEESLKSGKEELITNQEFNKGVKTIPLSSENLCCEKPLQTLNKEAIEPYFPKPTDNHQLLHHLTLPCEKTTENSEHIVSSLNKEAIVSTEDNIIIKQEDICNNLPEVTSITSTLHPSTIQKNNEISVNSQTLSPDINLLLQHMTGVLTYPINQDEDITANSLPLPLSPQEQQDQQQPHAAAAAAAVLNCNSSLEAEDLEADHISNPSASEFSIPKISLIPLSRLIASEYWETPNTHVTNGEIPSILDIPAPKIVAPTTPQRQTFKPNLVKRKRNISTCSNTSNTSNSAAQNADPIVEKLVTMNKINIKNIINSCDTKYDEALKQQARKRLKEEIRRQLKSLNIESAVHKTPQGIEFVPDEIVDSMNIPAFVLEEIRKVLGLVADPQDIKFDQVEKEILDLATESEIIKSENVEKETTATTCDNMVNQNDICPGQKNGTMDFNTQMLRTQETQTSAVTSCQTHTRSEDLLSVTVKTELINETTPPSASATNKHKDDTTKRKHKKSRKSLHKKKTKSKSNPKIVKDIIIVDSSSNSSENSSTSSTSSSTSSTSSSSSSDSESDSTKQRSSSSSSSAIKRKRLKLKVDAENVVDSFEKLILPSLSERLQERYNSKHSNSIHTKLHFISCICVSDYNSEKFSKMDIAKIQRNLKSTDCSMALEFLMREIVNVCNKQKQVAKLTGGDNNKQALSNTLSPDNGHSGTSPTKSASSDKLQPLNSSNNVTPTTRLNILEDEDIDNDNALQKCVSKVLSLYRQEMKAANQQSADAAAGAAAPPITTFSSSTVLPTATPPQCAKSPPLYNASDSSAVAFKNTNGVKHHKDEPAAQQHINKIAQLQRETENQFNHIRSLTSLSSSDYNLLPIDTTAIRFNTGIFDFPTSSFTPQPHTFPALDLETLKKQSPIGEAVVNNLREIDLKLMELHKRKMFIEEMILKLQKDKMDTDLLTIKLQNEKFILLNTAMTANVTNSTSSSGITAEKVKETDSVIYVKNIKTETVEIPDDDDDEDESSKQEAVIPPTPQTPQIQSETVMPPITKELQLEESIAPIIKFTQKQITNPPKQILTELQDKELQTTSRKGHISSSTSSAQRTKRKASTSEALMVGETFKRLREEAQKSEKSKRPSRNSSPSVHSSNDHQSLHKEQESEHNRQSKEDSHKITSSKNSYPVTPEPELSNSPKQHEDIVSITKYTTKTQLNHHQASGENLTSTTLTPPPPLPSLLTLENSKTLETSQEQITNGNTSNDTVKANNIDDTAHSPEMYFSIKNMPNGMFKGLESPIAQVRLYENKVIASSEIGKIFTFDASTLELINTYNKHTEAITQMHICVDKGFLFTTSLDGYLKKSLLENLSSGTQSVYLKEPLQSLDIQWDMAYVGSRWGNIYMCNTMSNIRSAALLCSTESSIITIKAAKEGPRKVLIVTSKGNLIHVRDATSGLLLRTFDVPEFINVYSILLNDGILYCGTQKKEIRKYDFVSGAPSGSITCGNGAVTMLMFRNKFMFVGCYDGYIYILDKETGRQVSRLTGSGKMILTLEIVGDKIITSAKDCTMKVINIPTFCLGNSL